MNRFGDRGWNSIVNVVRVPLTHATTEYDNCRSETKRGPDGWPRVTSSLGYGHPVSRRPSRGADFISSQLAQMDHCAKSFRLRTRFISVCNYSKDSCLGMCNTSLD